MVEGVAPSRGPMRSTASAGSPTRSPPSRATMSARRSSVTGSLAGVERVDHLAGDVDARAGVDGVLHDQVVLLGVEYLLDHPVGPFDHHRKLFVLALVEVFLELAA